MTKQRYAPRRTEEVLRHLQEMRPHDGWSIDSYSTDTGGKRLFVLKRRNVAISATGFEELVLDPTTKCVVGITDYITGGILTSYARGSVLVEADGSVATSRVVRVTLPNASSSKRAETSGNAALRKNDRERIIHDSRDAMIHLAAATNNNPFQSSRFDVFRDMPILAIGLMVLGALVLLKILAGIFHVLCILAVPLSFLFGVSTCPSLDSFDAKRELKRILRGENLPEDHPDKPNTWFSKTMANVSASIGAEVATSLGYEVSSYNLGGACILMVVRVPSVRLDLYWIGILHEWRFVTQREIPMNHPKRE